MSIDDVQAGGPGLSPDEAIRRYRPNGWMKPPSVNATVWRRSLRPDAGRYGDSQQTGTVLAVVQHKDAAFGWVALIHWHGQRVGAFSAHEGIEFTDQTGGVRIWVA